MTRTRRLLLVALVLSAAGCTFERRPGPNGDDAPGVGEGGVGTAAVAPTDSAAAARGALERFQELRRDGDAEGVRGWMTLDGVVLRSGEPVAWGEAGTPADTLLAPGARLGSWRLRVDARSLGEGRLFVLAYPPASGAGAGVQETVILVPSGEDGWRVRLLHRTFVP